MKPDVGARMNPEWALAVVEKFPALTRGAAKLADEALGSTKFSKALGFAKSPGQMLSDLAEHFPSLKIEYPESREFLNGSVKDLKHDFLRQRNALTKALAPAESHLPHLGFHGTSAEGADTILGSQAFKPIDFATATTDATQTPAGTFVSGTGKGMETAVSFASKWNGRAGQEAGPVFVLDIGKADQLSQWKNEVRLPYSDGEPAGMSGLMPVARQFKGTLYNIHEGNFSSIVAGHIDFKDTQREMKLASLLNQTAQEKLAGGIPSNLVYADVAQRGNLLSATKRLDLAHQAIAKWLEHY
ncbi:MAG: hypothetical protein P4L53_26335 [Candidatus Obscuribacterales bacterium]|nr:hypothetical protein [Candidatus Obscuribacterales bacterium]